MHRRMFLKLSAAAPFVITSRATWAQSAYPSRSIEFIIPLPPGGPTDTAPRILLESMRQTLNVNLVPVNKPGAGGAIASGAVAKSAPDGYTVLATSNPMISVKTAIETNLNYKIEDFTALGMYATDVGILVANKNTGISSIEDLITKAKANPDKLSYASAGPGAVSHISIELFKNASGTKILHVPHKGSAQASTAVLGGHLPLLSAAYSTISPLIKSGDFIPLVTTAEKRLPELPNVPTMAEKGVADATLNIWMGMFVPAATPSTIVAKLTETIAVAAKDPKVRERLTRANMIPVYGNPKETRALLDREYKAVSALAKKVDLLN